MPFTLLLGNLADWLNGKSVCDGAGPVLDIYEKQIWTCTDVMSGRCHVLSYQSLHHI